LFVLFKLIKDKTLSIKNGKSYAEINFVKNNIELKVQNYT